jgi:UDP-N-acetyl-D-galactosamine dehydrogenase
VILAGRRLNDGMGKYVAQQLEKAFKDRGISISDKRVLIMGLSFKENCPDLRNTKVIDTYTHLKELECLVDCYDPWIDEVESQKLYGIKLVKKIKANYYDAILLAVNHKEFIDLGSKGIKEGLTEGGIFYDMKSIFTKEESNLRL